MTEPEPILIRRRATDVPVASFGSCGCRLCEARRDAIRKERQLIAAGLGRRATDKRD